MISIKIKQQFTNRSNRNLGAKQLCAGENGWYVIIQFVFLKCDVWMLGGPCCDMTLLPG